MMGEGVCPTCGRAIPTWWGRLVTLALLIWVGSLVAALGAASWWAWMVFA